VQSAFSETDLLHIAVRFVHRFLNSDRNFTRLSPPNADPPFPITDNGQS
jgi:hypothetical protein